MSVSKSTPDYLSPFFFQELLLLKGGRELSQLLLEKGHGNPGGTRLQRISGALGPDVSSRCAASSRERCKYIWRKYRRSYMGNLLGPTTPAVLIRTVVSSEQEAIVSSLNGFQSTVLGTNLARA